MRKHVAFVAVGIIALLVFATAPAKADTIFATLMFGSNEVPANASNGFGIAFADLETGGNFLDVALGFAGLSAPASAAHIHCCAAPGSNAPVVLPFTGFPSSTVGTYFNTFDLTTALTGITQANFLAGLLSGDAYVNIHNANFPGGEVRGWLQPLTVLPSTTSVPEPGTLVLVGVGVAGLYASRRRKSVLTS